MKAKNAKNISVNFYKDSLKSIAKKERKQNLVKILKAIKDASSNGKFEIDVICGTNPFFFNFLIEDLINLGYKIYIRQSDYNSQNAIAIISWR